MVRGGWNSGSPHDVHQHFQHSFDGGGFPLAETPEAVSGPKFSLQIYCYLGIWLGCKCDRRVSKQKTQKKYEEMYMGPEFLIDFRYAQVNFY